MRVLIGAFGTRGDVQPMLALAQALVGRGHELLLAVPPNLKGLSRAFGLDAFAVGLDYEELSHRATHGSMREVLGAMPLVRGEVRAQLDALEQSAAWADLLVGSGVATTGAILGEKLRKPYVYFALNPQFFASGDHPSLLVPWQQLPRWLNRLSKSADAWLWQRVLGGTVNSIRAERGLARTGNVWRTLLGTTPVAAFDPVLAPAPADAHVPITQVGALFAHEAEELSSEVSAFLDAGPPPVYLGFGSMSDPDPRGTANCLLESVRRAGVRALISRGWAKLAMEAPPVEVLFIGAEPHGKLFPRCAAVVHHGGAGTTHAAARAGVPQVLMPQLLDQHFWAYRAWRAGISPPKVPRHTRNPELLARALRTCLEDAALRARAREVSDALRTDGADTSAVVLERLARA